MYLFIMEDGEVLKGETVSENDKKASDDGILEIINVNDLTIYFKGEWLEIDKWEF